MKVLFLSVTIGAGHNAVANNIKKLFDDGGHETKLVDMFKNNKVINKAISGYGFNAMYQFPKIANYYYFRSRKKDRSLFDGNVKFTKKFILKEINDFEPDIIISSHIAGSIFTQKYKNEIKKSFRSCFIVTDYGLTPSLHNVPELQEIIFTPSDVFTKELVDSGFDKNLVFSSGIPISSKFYNKLDKSEIIKNRGIKGFDLNKKTILFMGGGKGLGKMKAVVKYLTKYKDLQLLVVCGRNEKLKKQIEKLEKSNIYVFGFVDFVDELMTLADYLFGKVGGLSATEALAKDVEIISFKNIPCPEYENLLFLENYGYAKAVKNVKQVSDYIFNKQKQKKDKSFYIENSASIIYNKMLEISKK